MSKHNLLELDELTDRHPLKQAHALKPRFQPKSNPPKSSPFRLSRQRNYSDDEVSILEEERKAEPQPKPRRKERDVDEVRSLSSSSAGDHKDDQYHQHISKSATYDNPAFHLEDQGDQFSGENSRRRRRLHPHFDVEESPSTKEDRKAIKKGQQIKARYDDSDQSSTPWEGEEDTYLSVQRENENREHKRTANKKHYPEDQQIKSPKQSNESSRRNSETTPQHIRQRNQIKKDQQGEHVTLEMEQVNIPPSSPSPKKIMGVKKALPLGRIWQRLLSRAGGGTSSNNKQQQFETMEISEKSEQTKKEQINKGSRKVARPPGTTRKSVDIPSEQDEQVSSGRGNSDMRARRNTKLRSMEGKMEELNKCSDESDSDVRGAGQALTDMSPKIRHKRRNMNMNPMSPKSPNKGRGKKMPISRVTKESSTNVTPQHDPFLFFGITIHSSDLLPLDPNVLHPLVKVTLMTQDGKMLRKREDFGWKNESTHPPRPNSTSSLKKKQHATKRSNTDAIILPIMTQPFHFSFNSRNASVIIPVWEELIIFEEPFHHFLQENGENLVIFFEIMDFLPMSRKNSVIWHDGIHGSDVGWYKIAWAFLRGRENLNSDKRISLQLFKPGVGEKTLFGWKKEELDDFPEIYSWWKSGRREKLVNTTLHVTVKGISLPEPEMVNSSSSLRQLLSMRKEELTDALIESQVNKADKKRKRKKMQLEKPDPRKAINWSRIEGQTCKVPNTLIASLPSSPIESLNLTISGNVHSLKFSPCGLKLAAGLDTEDLHAVLLFEIPSGNLLRSLKNHHGIIYDLAWKNVETADEAGYTQYLASASADATACIWSMQNNDETTLQMLKTLHHPSFVYAVTFHPTHHDSIIIVVTGCFDFIIRIWDIQTNSPSQTDPDNKSQIHSKKVAKSKRRPSLHTAAPLFILDRHCSYVNCLVFDFSGSCMFSGDGDSFLFKWCISKVKSPTKRKSWSLERETKLTSTGKIPINSLSLHPNGIRLLVHLRDNCLKMVDTGTLTELKTIRGLNNDHLQIRSTFSPCGNLILSGNEDASFCVWDADTYSIADFISPKNHPHCFVTGVDYHPHDFYVAVGLASGISEPSPILLYGYQPPKFSQVAMVQAGVAKFKSNLAAKREKTNVHDEELKKGVTFATKRGDSKEKFERIINKLDAALKDSRMRQGHEIKTNDIEEVEYERKGSGKKSESQEKVHPPLISPNKDDSRLINPKPEKEGLITSPRTYIEERLEELFSPQTSQKPVAGAERTTAIVDVHAENVEQPPTTREKQSGGGSNNTPQVDGKVVPIVQCENAEEIQNNNLTQSSPQKASKIPVRIISNEEKNSTNTHQEDAMNERDHEDLLN